jgi:predicted ATP-binding protein involved in virulence
MKITRLSIAGLRAFEQASFDFDPAFTLLVGVNGVGKTTVLETLRIGLSRLLPQFTASKSRLETFVITDIRVGDSSLTVDLDFDLNRTEHHWLLHKQRDQNVPNKAGVVREQTLETPDRETLTPAFGKGAKPLRSAKEQPIGLYFATRRSLPSDEQVKIGKSRGGQATAFADALSPRPLRLTYLAEWMLAQERLSAELPRAGEHLKAFRKAAKRFLPDCEDLRAGKDDKERPRLLVTKGGVALDVRQLSDGERSMLALALDLAQRLSQANPGLSDPVRDGAAIVLIDELDMHLHPKWQRQVVGQLISTFPNCQFVATTHSPQIIGEVPHDRIRMIKDGTVYSPIRSFGIDSSRVLEEVMDTDSRNHAVELEIGRIAKLIADRESGKARAALEALSAEIGADDPEITRARTLLDFMEGDA